MPAYSLMMRPSSRFQGWSEDDAEGDEGASVANIIKNLEREELGCHDSGVGMGSNHSRPNFVGILPEDQTMVDMTAHYKAPGSGATMDHLRNLSNDIIKLTWQLNHKMELTTLVLFNKVKAGFSGTCSVARDFVSNMSKLMTDFFMEAWVYEVHFDSADSWAFHTAVEGLQDGVNELLCQAAILEDMYQHSRASFDTILSTMCQEVQNFTVQVSQHLCDEYQCRTFD